MTSILSLMLFWRQVVHLEKSFKMNLKGFHWCPASQFDKVFYSCCHVVQLSWYTSSRYRRRVGTASGRRKPGVTPVTRVSIFTSRREIITQIVAQGREIIVVVHDASQQVNFFALFPRTMFISHPACVCRVGVD